MIVSPEKHSCSLLLRIDNTFYFLRRIEHGWRLTKKDNSVYQVLTEPNGEQNCDCEAAVYRSYEVCKHRRALQAQGLIAKGK